MLFLVQLLLAVSRKLMKTYICPSLSLTHFYMVVKFFRKLSLLLKIIRFSIALFKLNFHHFPIWLCFRSRLLGWDTQDDENLTKPLEHSKDTACKLELSNFSETGFDWQSKFK